MLHCSAQRASPRAINSPLQYVRAKKPRSSSISSGSTMYAPAIPAEMNLIFRVAPTRGRAPLNNAWLRNRHDESPAAPPVFILLPENLIGKIPREQQHVIRHLLEQLLRRADRQMRARRVEPLLCRAAINHKIQHVPSDAAVIQQRRTFRRSAI